MLRCNEELIMRAISYIILKSSHKYRKQKYIVPVLQINNFRYRAQSKKKKQ